MMETMLQASALTLLALLLRRLLRGRASQRAICLLWLPVLLRLLLRGNLLRVPSPVSLMNPVQKALQNAPWKLQPLLNNFSTGQVRVPGPQESSLLLRAASVDWQLVGATVWFLGLAALLVYVSAVNLRFQGHLLRERAPLTVCGKLPVYTVPALESPCLALAGGEQGIYIPRALAEDPECLRHILAHESAHFRRHDTVWELLRLFLTVLYWWNPFVWLAAAYSRQDCELACDEAALEALGESERLAYGRTLIRLAERGAAPQGPAPAMSQGGRALRERVRQIANRPNRSKPAALLAALALALGSAAAFTTAVASAPDRLGIRNDHFSDDLERAIATVESYIAEHPVWQDASIYYDAEYDRKQRETQLRYGSVPEGCTEENLMVLLCDFTAGEGPVLTPGERYTRYNFILARSSPQDPWEIIDQGY